MSTAAIKKLFFILAVLFLWAVGAYYAFFYLDRRSEQQGIALNRSVTRLSPQERAQIQEGDFILRRGFGFFSDYIAKTLNTGSTDVTHAGIIINRNGRLWVIHALSSDVSAIDGVQQQTLDDFLRYSAPGKIVVTRAKGADAAFGKKVAARAQVYLSKKIPFDHTGVIDDTSKLFCTEMIWQILEKDLHHTTLPNQAEARKNFFYSMAPLYSTNYFDVIINQYAIK
jgi:hypothetical protein